MGTVRLLRRVVPAAALLLLVLLGAIPGATFAQDTPGAETGDLSPWTALDGARKSLAAAGAEQADFVQTYLPAGFSSGEKESGRIALRLPDCLRWDYDEPFPKSFLLCGDQVWSWNPQDRRGQTGALDRKSQPGLDLLLLPIEQLDTRYEATLERTDSTGSTGTAATADGDGPKEAAPGRPGQVRVHLTPKPEVAERTELTGATLVVDTETERLVELSYRDQEGNRTKFVLSDYRPLDDTNLFQAPDGITWEEMQ